MPTEIKEKCNAAVYVPDRVHKLLKDMAHKAETSIGDVITRIIDNATKNGKGARK